MSAPAAKANGIAVEGTDAHTTAAADVSAPSQQLKGFHVYPTWIFYGVFALMVGSALVVSQSLLLRAQSGCPCGGLKAIGGIFICVGFAETLSGLLALRYKALQPARKEPPSTAATALRWVFFIVMLIVFAVSVAAIVLGSAFWAMSRSLPQLDLDFKLEGLQSTVTVQRDASGIPHITAQNIYDLVQAQGWVTAQDRIFQLEMYRQASAGRLAEFFGSGALDVDRAVRAINLERAGQLLCGRMTAAETYYVQRYVDGINAYLRSDGALSPEFMFMGPTLFTFHKPDDFTVADVCRIGRLFMFQLADNSALEVARWKLFSRLGRTYSEIRELFPTTTNSSFIVPPADLGITEAKAVAARAREAKDALEEQRLYDKVMWNFRENETAPRSSAAGRAFDAQQRASASRPSRAGRDARGIGFRDWLTGFQFHLIRPGRSRGSNGWAVRVGGQAGRVVGAGDPHLDATVPSIWHQVQLTVGNNISAGGSAIPGLPGIVYGRTNRIFWSITLSFGDLQDLFVMDPDPANPETHYLYHGQSVAYQVRTETIKVKGAANHVLQIQESVLGPVVSPHWDISDRHRLALNATGVLSDGTVSPFLDLWLSASVSSAVAALSKLSAPGFSITLGDSQGGLAYVCTGMHPIRASGHTGQFPVLGNGSFDYLGYVPFSALPKVVDTNTNVNGRVASGNNKIYSDGYGYSLGYDYWFPDRFDRFTSLIDAELAKPITVSRIFAMDFHAEVQLDVRSNAWVTHYRPALVALGANWTSRLSTAGLAAWQAMLSWGNRSEYGAPEPATYVRWLARVAQLPRDEIAVLEWNTFLVPFRFPLSIITSPGPFLRSLCSQRTGGGSCVDWTAAAWNEAAALPPKRWGVDINVLRIEHLVFGGSFLNCFFDQSIPKDGDFSTVNFADISPEDLNVNEFYVTAVPSMRNIYSFEFNASKFALPGGNSGHRYSEYFANLGLMYSAGGYTDIQLWRLNGSAVHTQQYSP